MVFLGQQLWRSHRFKATLAELSDALKRLKLLVIQEARIRAGLSGVTLERRRYFFAMPPNLGGEKWYAMNYRHSVKPCIAHDAELRYCAGQLRCAEHRAVPAGRCHEVVRGALLSATRLPAWTVFRRAVRTPRLPSFPSPSCSRPAGGGFARSSRDLLRGHSAGPSRRRRKSGPHPRR